LLVEKTEKDEKISTGCRKGAGFSFLCLRATGETKKINMKNILFGEQFFVRGKCYDRIAVNI
jgi:hypothetical protein